MGVSRLQNVGSHQRNITLGCLYTCMQCLQAVLLLQRVFVFLFTSLSFIVCCIFQRISTEWVALLNVYLGTAVFTGWHILFEKSLNQWTCEDDTCPIFRNPALYTIFDQCINECASVSTECSTSANKVRMGHAASNIRSSIGLFTERFIDDMLWQVQLFSGTALMTQKLHLHTGSTLQRCT